MRRLAVALFLVLPMLAAEAAPGWLGIAYLYTKRGPQGWMTVRHLIPNSPAAKAGLRPRDIVTHIDGKPLTVSDQYGMIQLLRGVRPGQKVRFTVRRGEQTLAIVMTAATMTPQQERLWRESLEYERSRAGRR